MTQRGGVVTPPGAGSGVSGARALALCATSVGLVWVTAFLGASPATRVPPGAGALPPYDLQSLGVTGAPSPWLVVGLLVLAVAAGVAGLLFGLAALARGWAPAPRRLVAFGLVAAGLLLLVPPTTSDDLYSYTAYGRIAALGRDPYATTPNDLPDDPVAREAGEPWRDVPSVYGPVATGVQALAARAAGPHPRTAATLLALTSAAAFGLTGLVLDRLAASEAGRRRAALLWTANPLLLVHLVAGAHLDALLVLLAVAAVAAARRSYLAAGALAGAAACVKLSGALAGVALAWSVRRQPRRLLAVAIGAVLVTPPAYVLVGGWSALGPVRRASRFVSFGSPWRALSVPLDDLVGSGPSRTIVSALSLLVVALLCALLARGLPSVTAPASAPASGPASTQDRTAPHPAAVLPRTAAVVTLAWLIGATYVLPWYDAWAWPFLALLPASRWDRWLAVRTAVLTVAYLPGRIAPLPPVLAGLLSGTRLYVTPVALGLLAVLAVRWCRESA
ncbi:MAG TPA: polyprenol phosphomannose-dependent alpha 1,6 mannosyltransferase MptB [Frankiaceae bacterium]|nr:polyprenol phosphomannose-dependent alpha 1,6 mannosyltransferase MptB [Frankiaceae bacterium]